MYGLKDSNLTKQGRNPTGIIQKKKIGKGRRSETETLCRAQERDVKIDKINLSTSYPGAVVELIPVAFRRLGYSGHIPKRSFRRRFLKKSSETKPPPETIGGFGRGPARFSR